MALDMGAGAREKGPKVGPRFVGKGVQRRLSVRNTLRTEDESAAPAAGLDKVARFVSDMAAVTEYGRAKVRCPVSVPATRTPPLLL